jgi:aminoglycoside phosphotransferase (APT) family kinase protein
MTAKKVHADQIETSAGLVHRLIADQFPQWANLDIEPVPTGGTENAIYRLGEDMAVRMPYRPVRGDQIDKLDKWLPKLAQHLPLPVPLTLGTGEPTDDFPCAWSVVRWLDGEEVRFDRLADPVEAAHALAEFERALMAIDATSGPLPGKHNFERGVPLAYRDPITRKCIAQCEGLIDVDAVTEAWERDLNAPVWDKPGVWIHGDLAPDNLLMVDGRLSAVIDWGGLAVGDPCYELQPAWNLFRGESRDAYREALGLDEAAWRRSRGFALSTAVVALPYYKDTLPKRAEGARKMIDEVLEDQAPNG